MKTIRLNLIVLLLLRLFLAGVMAQETIPAAGGDASGTGGSVAYTVGQVAFSSFNGIYGSTTLGVQQPYEITVTKGPANALTWGIKCFVYPNPVTDQLKLRVESENEILLSTLSYRLYAADGTLLFIKGISGPESVIPMNKLAKSAYFLQVFNSKNVIVEFTIIKN